MPIARQQVGKHIPATHKQAKIGRQLPGNGAVKRLRQQWMLFSVRSVQIDYKKNSAGQE
jgi:hypothetical protein